MARGESQVGLHAEGETRAGEKAKALQYGAEGLDFQVASLQN